MCKISKGSEAGPRASLNLKRWARWGDASPSTPPGAIPGSKPCEIDYLSRHLSFPNSLKRDRYSVSCTAFSQGTDGQKVDKLVKNTRCSRVLLTV